jgi:hypothetical protein
MSPDENPDGSKKVRLSAYALALMATRVQDGKLEVHQEASWTDAKTETAARDVGLQMAREKWPSAEGWSHQAAIRKMNVVLDLFSKDAKT